MPKSVSVLLPSGRRQIVQVTPNTSILQILEDVCKKQGLSSAEYDLKHSNKILDLSSTVQFSNLPNNVLLELIKSARSKIETDVTIVLQLPTGERLVSAFPASTTLWEILTYWDHDRELNLLHSTDDGTLEPVCIYIRREISGEEELKTATLRTLGLISGKAIIRLLFRPSNKPVEQAYHENILRLCANKPGPSTETLDSAVTSEDRWGRGQTLDNVSSKSDASLSGNSYSCKRAAEFEQEESMETVDEGASKTLLGSKTSSEAELEGSRPFVESVESLESVDTIEEFGSEEFLEVPVKLNSDEELEEEKVTFLDDKGTLLYCLDDVPEPVDDRLTEDFFEVNIDDVKLLLADIRRQRKELEDVPLRTQALREAEYLTRLRKYPKAVLRVHFPDRLVLQCSFKATDTVSKVVDLVRSFLEDESLDFSLYITPPKRALHSEERLFEIPLVPTAVVYFSCAVPKEHYLKQKVRGKISSLAAANHSATSIRSGEIDSVKSSTSHFLAKPAKSADDKRTASSSRQTSLPSRSTGAVPKWFQKGKK